MSFSWKIESVRHQYRRGLRYRLYTSAARINDRNAQRYIFIGTLASKTSPVELRTSIDLLTINNEGHSSQYFEE